MPVPVRGLFPTPLQRAIGLVAPGNPLRQGLDRILQARMGALIVVGDGPQTLAICSGGFLLDAEFTPQRLSELAKMDGAIVLAPDASRIARANVHLLPDPTVLTSETGTRHRTAERVSRSLGIPTISVSERMGLITVYRGEEKHLIETTGRLFDRSAQAVQVLSRYRARFDQELDELTRREFDDSVAVRDVATAIQRAELVRRLADELDLTVFELGDEGRLIALQVEELVSGVVESATAILRDYLADGWEDGGRRVLGVVNTDDLVHLDVVAHAIGLSGTGRAGLHQALHPRGYRLLSSVPRLSESVISELLERFSSLRELQEASHADLVGLDHIGEVRARTIRDGLSRLAAAAGSR